MTKNRRETTLAPELERNLWIMSYWAQKALWALGGHLMDLGLWFRGMAMRFENRPPPPQV